MSSETAAKRFREAKSNNNPAVAIWALLQAEAASKHSETSDASPRARGGESILFLTMQLSPGLISGAARDEPETTQYTAIGHGVELINAKLLGCSVALWGGSRALQAKNTVLWLVFLFFLWFLSLYYRCQLLLGPRLKLQTLFSSFFWATWAQFVLHNDCLPNVGHYFGDAKILRVTSCFLRHVVSWSKMKPMPFFF